jgi:hypothetical protein
MFSAGRSFTLPPGLLPSSLAKIFTAPFGLSRCSSTIGVLPTVSKTLAITFVYRFRFGLRSTVFVFMMPIQPFSFLRSKVV